MTLPRLALASLFLVYLTVANGAQPGAAPQSARQIPVAAEVDVLVLGGSTGAVAAAQAAAAAGAKVFLAAPRPYLGDDMTAALRLWLEPGETPTAPLARQLFSDAPADSAADPDRLEFTYAADVPSVRVHQDTRPPSLLTDGRWASASQESVQYPGKVTITADMRRVQAIEKVRIWAYERTAAKGFHVGTATVAVSDDGKRWRTAATIDNQQPTVYSGGAGEDQCVPLEAALKANARYVRFEIAKTERADRILLGEIEIVGPAQQKTPTVKSQARPPRPLHVKRTLDDALLAAGVTFLYSCFPTDVVRDAQGQLCGLVMANRSGRQAVLAKTVIDATERGTLARLAGANFRPYPTAAHTFRRVVIGGEVRQGPGVTARIIDPPFRGPFPNQAKTSSGVFPIIEYTLRLAMPNDSFSAWAAADQQARSLTYHREQQFTSDQLFEVPPDPLHGEAAAKGSWAGVDALAIGAFRPAGIARLYVLSGVADVSREQAEKLLRPLALIDLGARIGKAAAAEAAPLAKPAGAHVAGGPIAKPAAAGDVKEFLAGARPGQKTATIPQTAAGLPVLAVYDVVVIGGGTTGAPAGIGAARHGARTLVVEQLTGLGGVGTLGAISKYYWGNRIGFTATVVGGSSWVIEEKAEWYRDELRKANADVWFGAIGAGAFVDHGRVAGAVVATPFGRGVVLAKVVIDATGNADVAAAAGAKCTYTDESEFGMQGTGLPPRNLGASYANTDFTITDETDIVDIWHLFVYAKHKYPKAFDQGNLIDTRERRRIVGEFTITILDQLNARTYPDTLFVAYSNFDTHGYTVDPLLMLHHPDKKGFYVNVPYRCSLPKDFEGLLVGGLGLSAHRDAIPLVRMQADLQNQGYGLGVAASMAAKSDTLVRHIDFKALQQHLIEIGNLPESVLTDRDSYPLPADQVAAAVAKVQDDFSGAAVILAAPETALPMLRKAYADATGEARVNYAKILAMLGDATGLDALLEAVCKTAEWDAGWRYRGGGQFGHALSPLDTLVIALGRTGDKRAVPAIVEKARLLQPDSEFSHFRAAALALELIGAPAGAEPLARLLALEGVGGYVHATVAAATELGGPPTINPNLTREQSLRELMLARALYRCGDHEGRGQRTLKAYAHDLRGHLARHAQAVLSAPPAARSGR